MDYNRWTPDLPAEILALKLQEEAAEVGTEITDAYQRGNSEIVNRVQLAKELRHLTHLIDCIRVKFDV